MLYPGGLVIFGFFLNYFSAVFWHPTTTKSESGTVETRRTAPEWPPALTGPVAAKFGAQFGGFRRHFTTLAACPNRPDDDRNRNPVRARRLPNFGVVCAQKSTLKTRKHNPQNSHLVTSFAAPGDDILPPQIWVTGREFGTAMGRFLDRKIANPVLVFITNGD